MNFVLFVISFLLVGIFTPLGFIATIIKSIIYWERGVLSDYYFNLAISLDQFGNVAMAGLFGFLFITRKSENLFGNPDETISSVLGKNQIEKTLTIPGKILVFILHVIDKNHSIKSIEN